METLIRDFNFMSSDQKTLFVFWSICAFIFYSTIVYSLGVAFYLRFSKSKSNERI